MSVRYMQDQALRAAREGRSIRKWLSEVTVTGAFVVSTNVAIYYDIPAGKQVVVSRVFIGCETPLNYVASYVVGCAEIAGGGAITQQNNHIHDHVGDKKEGSGHIFSENMSPIVLKYSDGYLSLIHI